MKKTLLIILLLIFTFSLFGASKTRYNAKADPVDYRPHTIGGMWTVESNRGQFGDPNADATGNPSFDYPGGFGWYYQWEGRLWVGTEIGGTPYVSHCDYGNYELTPDDGSWKWIGPGTSQWDIVSAYNDWGSLNAGREIGIHVEQRAFQWSMPEYGDFIGYEFYIVWDKSNSNVASGEDEIDVYVAWCWDSDVCENDPENINIDDMVSFDGFVDGEWTGLSFRPAPSDEYTITQEGATEGSDGVPDQWQVYGDNDNEELLTGDTVWIPRNMSYIYDDDNPSEPGDDEGDFGACAGYIFGRFIYGPPKANDIYRLDADGNPARVPVVTTHQWWNWNNDPGTDVNKYDYMTGRHSMSLGYKFIPTPYDVGAATFDYRYLQTVGPYTLEAYDTLKLVYVSGVGYGLNGGTDEYYGTGDRLGARHVADYALDAYYMGSENSDPIHPSAPDEDGHWILPVPPEVPELHYSASGGVVNLIWSNIAEVTPDPVTGDLDFAGYRVYRSPWRAGNWELLDSFTVVQGNIQREFSDEDIDVGVPYYYAVTAFDDGGLESGKTNYMKDAQGAPLSLNVASPLGSALDSVKVVPNPYYGSASWEAQYEDKIKFMYLPQNSRVKVFSLSGDLLWEAEHISTSGDLDWDLVCESGIKASSGLYVYKIEQSNASGEEVVNNRVGKLLIMR